MIDCKYYRKKNGKNKSKCNSRIWVSKLLLSIIFILTSLIYMNISDDTKSNFEKNVLEDNIDFYDINQVYDKYVGDGEKKSDTELTFNDSIIASEVISYGDSYRLNVGNDYLINIMKPGIIVYIGDKEGLGNTVIVQGNDGVDYWYSNIDNLSVNLYDYIEKDILLGVSRTEYVYLTFVRNGEYVDYEEFI